ncbi:MAG: NCS1 family nucleobase:cation symporter-1 [Terrimicrobiaceae bacterium]|nr:NCS1 family nucleobase:cation symporter-1 [Terrimicrobiaceae bacterium]
MLPNEATRPSGFDTILWNKDLAPVRPEERKWGKWDIAALWVGMAVCIPTYQLASGLIASGMNWWQAVLTVFLGNVIVLIPMALNARAGTAWGIPFPVLLRSSFGVFGANIPALMRAVVACGWFGIQTWIGGSAIYSIAAAVFGFDAASRVPWPVLGISSGEIVCFLIFWAMNMAVVVKGIDCIRWLENWGAPFLLLIGVGLLIWAGIAADGFGPILSQPSQFQTPGEFWAVFIPGLTAMVGFWATLSLNIPDFSRFARSQRDQVLGQIIGLPGTMAFYAFIGVVTTSATIVVFGAPIWDPVQLLARFDHPLIAVPGLIALVVATLTTNIAANIVSPANDFSNVWPSRISFRTGGLIAGVLGILFMPWKLVADPEGYIFRWLIGYSALLGPIGGIMIADYFLVRRQSLNVEALYRCNGEYGRFQAGALLALALAILPHVPGFLVEIDLIPATFVPGFFRTLYSFSWFSGFAIAFVLHLTFKKLLRS